MMRDIFTSYQALSSKYRWDGDNISGSLTEKLLEQLYNRFRYYF
jgi:hypothetical protein